MSKGVLMFAHNNTEIDYFKIACANALMVKHNLGVPVTLVTDESTYKYGQKTLGKTLVGHCFNNVQLVKRNRNFDNKRHYADASTRKTLQFYNCNHWEAYGLSPYDETLFIDVDYLIMSSELNKCWESENDLMINSRIFTPCTTTDPYFEYIDNLGIRQYWATVIYFRKSELAENIFNIVQHVQENYAYYRQLYGFRNTMFRNDFAFSIAVHMMNGFTEDNPIIQELPNPGLLMSWDSDDIHSVPEINKMIVYSERKDSDGLYYMGKITNQDIHIMNKWAISRVADRLIELYK